MVTWSPTMSAVAALQTPWFKTTTMEIPLPGIPVGEPMHVGPLLRAAVHGGSFEFGKLSMLW